MTITALDADRQVIYRQTYYSIGGGFIVDEAHFWSRGRKSSDSAVSLPTC